ncbi:RNA polymerase sigma factor [Adhaeretor mobilis]|uniref:RNA polymerase sigma factor n=1 Tax=Adhaeretor mobilis TaxID=1930276 RepID=UPI00119F5F65|nr:sigma-70 family RNA polymerase sigma factor [Adhaeretor mobilis]
MALSDLDRTLISDCLSHKSRAWEDFVDRFTGLVLHVINHSAQSRAIMLSNADREDLAAEVLLTIIRNDYQVLRDFRGEASLATYLTVIARRVAVAQLLKTDQSVSLDRATAESVAQPSDTEQRITDKEEVQRLMGQLDSSEAAVVRMYHLEGKTYQEIGRTTGMPTNSVGPLLSRARAKLRSAEQSSL